MTLDPCQSSVGPMYALYDWHGITMSMSSAMRSCESDFALRNAPYNASSMSSHRASKSAGPTSLDGLGAPDSIIGIFNTDDRSVSLSTHGWPELPTAPTSCPNGDSIRHAVASKSSVNGESSTD